MLSFEICSPKLPVVIWMQAWFRSRDGNYSLVPSSHVERESWYPLSEGSESPRSFLATLSSDLVDKLQGAHQNHRLLTVVTSAWLFCGGVVTPRIVKLPNRASV
jgi:hypothetical protein